MRRQTASTPLCYFSSPKICPREDYFFLSHCLSMKLIPSSPDGLPILADKLQTQLLSGESSRGAAVKKPKRFRRVCVVCFIIKLNVPPFLLPPAVLSKAGKWQLVIADKCFMNLNRLDYSSRVLRRRGNSIFCAASLLKCLNINTTCFCNWSLLLLTAIRGERGVFSSD